MSTHTTSGNSGANARVVEVIKSSLERRLIDEQDVVLLAGHGSHVVTDIVEPGAPAPAEGLMAVGWDESKHREFAERLSKLRAPKLRNRRLRMKTAMLVASLFVVGCSQSAPLSEKEVVTAVHEQMPGATSITVRSILPLDRQKEAKKIIKCNDLLDHGFTYVAEVTHVTDLGDCPMITTHWTKCGITKEDQVLCFKQESGKWAYSPVMDPNALIPGGTAQNPAR